MPYGRSRAGTHHAKKCASSRCSRVGRAGFQAAHTYSDLFARCAEDCAQANALAEAEEVTANTLYELAGACALASSAIEDDAKLHDQYTASAFESLRRAVPKGYKVIEHLNKDEDLRPLRERGDFQKLIMEMEQNK